MTTKINGTNTAASPAITGADTDTGLSFGTDTVNINTGGTTRATVDSSGALDVPTTFPIKVNGSEKLRIDSSGNLGIGTTSPTARFDVRRGDADGLIAEFHQSGGYGVDIGSSTSTGYIASGYGQALAFKTDPSSGQTERMRIDSSGNVGIGTTSPDRLLHVSKAGPDVVRIQQSTNNQGSNHACISLVHAAATASAQGVGMVFVNASGSDVGSIRFGSSTSYNTSSDYRLKENVTPISDGITRLKTLKPSRFNFKIDKDTTVDGFLAHEVTAVPEAITGTKDEVDSDNNPVYQGIDQSKLVPLLTAALQEAVAKIETLETKVAALEAG